jgi:hypothetical protein
MKRATTATSVLALLIPSLLCVASTHANQVAGTYFGVASLPGIGVPIVDALTFHSDGTFTGTAYDDFGFGNIAASGFTSPEHGAWRQVGPRSIETSSVSQSYNPNGAPGNIVRIDSNIELSPDASALTGKFNVLIFATGQNPLVDAPATVLPGGTFTMARLGSAEPPGAIAARVAGTYFGAANATGIADPIVDALTFNADGTFTGTASDDFGFGNIAANGFNSPEQGTWRQIGPRSIETRSLSFGYNANGLLENVYRTDSTAEFTEDFNRLNGSFAVHVFLPEQDPLVDNPVASIPGTYAVNRLGVEQAANNIRQHVAGTYIGTATAEGIGVPIADILTFNDDGTFKGTASDDYGFGDIAANGFNSPEQGTWRQVGPRSIETSSLSYGYNANGVLENIYRTDSTAEFTADFNTLNGSFAVNVFLPDQNPLVDNPVASIPGTYSVARLKAIPEPSTLIIIGALAIATLTVRRTRHAHATVVTLFIAAAIASSSAQAGTVFFDDFSDGSVTNGLPLANNGTAVKWTDGGAGNYHVSSGEYVFAPAQPQNERYMVADALDFPLADVSVRVQGRLSGGNQSDMMVTARNQVFGDTQHYIGGIGYYPDLGGTVIYIGKNNPGINYTQFGGNPVMPFDIREEDAVLQVDVIGNRISLWAWRAGDTPPSQPQLTAIDNQYTTAGPVRIVGGTGVNRDNTTTFRWVHVSDTHIPIPEPSTGVLLAVSLVGIIGWQVNYRHARWRAH